MSRTSNLLLALGLTFVGFAAVPAVAQDTLEATNCERADSDLKRVSQRLDDSERQTLFDQIYSDLFQIDALRKNPTGGVSSSYLARCLDLKRRALFLNIENASGAFRTSFDVTIKLAKLHRHFGSPKQSLEMYERALKMREDAHNVRMEYFYLWKEQSQNRITRNSAKALSSSDFKTFLEKFNEILNPIFRDTQAPQDLRVQAYMERASLYAEASQWAHVLKDFEAVLALDPSHAEARQQLILYNCSRRILTECRKHLEKYLAYNPTNLQSTIQLLSLQYEDEDYDAILKTSFRALKQFPQNQDVMAIRGLVLAQYGRETEARQLIDAVLQSSPKNTWALRARARDLYSRANEHQKRGLLSNALKSLEEASETMKLAGLSNERDGLDIKERMGLMIYDFLRSKNFPNTDAARADAKRVVELLTPIFSNASKKRNTANLVEVYFHSLEMTGAKDFASSCRMMRQHNVAMTQSNRAVRFCPAAMATGSP